MKQAKVSDLKNQLSRYLDYVRNGETVLVLDRKVPVAELRPVSAKTSNGRIAALERKGIIRRGRGQFSAKFLKSLPAGNPAGVVAALLDEREKGR
jgi:antitoxin (DNA-binding transcriptional repressor) of toxin-antitoxin stability system